MPIAKRYYERDPKPHFVIEQEIVEYVKWLNPKVDKRVKERVEKEKGEAGFIGQELFEGFLLQHKIPHVYAYPLYENKEMRQINGKHFDFIIPGMPNGMQIVSVKTTPEGPNRTRFMANVKKWNDEIQDIVLIIKIDSLNENKARIAGWLTKEDVEELPVHNFDKENWVDGDAYWTYIDRSRVLSHKDKEDPGNSSPKLKILRKEGTIVEQLMKCSWHHC